MKLVRRGSVKVEIEASKFSPIFEGWQPPALGLVLPLERDPFYDKIFEARGLEVGDRVKLASQIVSSYKPDLLALQIPFDRTLVKPERCVEICSSIAESVDTPLLILGSGSLEYDRPILEKLAERLEPRSSILGPADMGSYRTYVGLCSIYDQHILARSTTDINQAKQLIQLILEEGFPRNRLALDIASTGLGLGLEDTYNLVEQAKLLAGRGDPALSVPIAAFTVEAWDSPEIYREGFSASKGALWESISGLAYLSASIDLLVMIDPEAFQYLKRFSRKLSWQGGVA